VRGVGSERLDGMGEWLNERWKGWSGRLGRMSGGSWLDDSAFVKTMADKSADKRC
jgi:hypothetical protein